MVASGVSYRKGKDEAPKKKAMRLGRTGYRFGDVVFVDAQWS